MTGIERPRILLVDEPTSSLDPRTSEAVMALIVGLAAEDGIPALVNIHDVLQIETIDRRPIEAIRATGASPAAVLVYGVLPQVLPRIVGLTIYQWDIHLRQSTIVGIVGAGGIGATLYNAFARYDYDFALAILLVIVLIVLAGEAVSAVARKRRQ